MGWVVLTQLVVCFFALACSASAVVLIIFDHPWWGGAAGIVGVIAFFNTKMKAHYKSARKNKCAHPDWYADREYGTVFCRTCHTEISKHVVQARRDNVAKEVKASVLRDIAMTKSKVRDDVPPNQSNR